MLKNTLVAVLLSTFALQGAFASPGAHGPNGEHLDGAANTTGTGLSRLPDGSVNVPKLAQRRMGILTVMAPESDHPRTIELNGRVTIDPNAGGRVQAPYAGRIEAAPKGLPMAGQRVEKGQVLAVLRPVGSAVEMGNQQAQLADIRASRQLAEQRLKRLETLADTVPRKEIEAARSELLSLSGRERAVAASVGGAEPLKSPASGVIASANVFNGQIIEARDVLFEVIDPARMVVEAQTADVSMAQRITEGTLAGNGGGELKLLGRTSSLRDGAVVLTFRVSGKDLALAVGQPVTVIGKMSDQVKGIVLPAGALVRNPNNEPIVWIKSGAERFMAQQVEVVPLDAKTVVVVKGLAPDNRVVVTGSALINQIR